MKILIIILSLFIITSCNKEETEPCPNGKQLIFKVRCDNCSASKPLNVKIQGNGINSGNALIASTIIHEIVLQAFNNGPSYIISTQTSSAGPSTVQSSGEVIINGCEKDVNVTVYY